MPSEVESLLEKFGENRSAAFTEVIVPCLRAQQFSMWDGQKDHSMEEFFRLGPFTNKRGDGIPHDGGFSVQPAMMKVLIHSFCATPGGPSAVSGLVKRWFPPDSTYRTPTNKYPATECAKGYRSALPVSKLG